MKRVMVIAAHPDDEILGAGGTLLRHKDRGDRVYGVLVTRATQPEWSAAYIEQKEKEIEKAGRAMRFDRLIRLELPAFQLNTIPIGRFNRTLLKPIQEIKPDIVYTHFEHDVNLDHQLVHEAVRVATRPSANYRPTVLEFETISSCEWSSQPFAPNYYVDIQKQLPAKLRALSAYRSEMKNWPHPRSLRGVETLAHKRGSEINRDAAEAFRLVRHAEV